MAALVLVATVLFFSGAVLLGNQFPQLGGYLMLSAFIGFGGTAFIVILSFIVKPYHLATFFSS